MAGRTLTRYKTTQQIQIALSDSNVAKQNLPLDDTISLISVVKSTCLSNFEYVYR